MVQKYCYAFEVDVDGSVVAVVAYLINCDRNPPFGRVLNMHAQLYVDDARLY